MGYCGACRREELTNMSIDDIEYKIDTILVTVPKTKTNVPRLFVISDEVWINLIQKYNNIRPLHTPHRRFFLTYRNGHCTTQPIGINTMGQMPKIMAAFLKLPNPEQYSGHCFRRSSASHLANQGGDLMTIKRHGGWKSSSVAEGYIEASLKKKTEVSQMLSTQSVATTSNNFNSIPDNSKKNIDVSSNLQQTFQNVPGLTINAAANCNISIKVLNNCTITNESLI